MAFKQQDTQDKTLEDCFRTFQKENKQFLFNKEFYDDNGFVANVLADFSIEDMEEEAYYVVTVDANFDDQPTNDPQEIEESKAVQEAVDYVQDAIIKGIDYSGFPNPETLMSDIGVSVRFTVIYNADNLA